VCLVPDKSSKPAPGANADYSWDEFDTEAYFTHYYRELHPDDERVIRRTVAALAAATPAGDALDVVDVGTGPNLFPLFAALPRASRLTVWEYAPTNVAWLKAEIERDDMRPQFEEFWAVVRDAWGSARALPDNPYPALRAKADIRRGSIFDLPERQWDAGTMFFCADSITERLEEFDRACGCFARAVKPGGVLAAAFLLRSGGYVVADRDFPVLTLTTPDIAAVFDRLATNIEVEEIGIVEEEIRSGYSGMLFLTGHAR
jgi:hypothetical protein